MMLFRSEEDVEAPSRRRGHPLGAILPVAQLHRLATAWFGDRLDPDWRPRLISHAQALLEQLGVTGDFWRLS